MSQLRPEGGGGLCGDDESLLGPRGARWPWDEGLGAAGLSAEVKAR